MLRTKTAASVRGGGALRKSRECKTVIKVFTKEEARKRNGFVGNKAPLTEVANTSQQRRRERSWSPIEERGSRPSLL